MLRLNCILESLHLLVVRHLGLLISRVLQRVMSEVEALNVMD